MSQKKLSIVYYHDLFDHHAGGILHYIRSILQYGEFKHKNIEYWGRDSKCTQKESATDPIVDKVTIRHHPTLTKPKIIPKLFLLIYAIWKKRKEIDENCDIIYTHTCEATLPWLFAPRKIPLVLTLHWENESITSAYPYHQVLFYRLADKLAIRRADKVIVVSQQAKEIYGRKNPKHDHKIIHYPTFADDTLVPEESKSQAKEILKIDSNRKVISFIGRFNPQKRVPHIIDVFKLLAEKDPNLYLYLAGNGPQDQQLRDQVKQLGLEDRVVFMGVISRREVGLLFRSSQLSILLTNYEGTPMSLLESLACGTPAVLSNVADHRNIVTNDKDGFVVENDWPNEKIAGKITNVLSDQQRFAGNAKETGKKYLASYVVPRIVREIESTTLSK